MSKIVEYSIHLLPGDAIEKFEQPSRRERGFLKIKEESFFGHSESLRIRPRAAYFAKSVKSKYPTYAVVYSNGKVKDCLFVFKFLKYADSDEYFIQMTRCVGKRATKKRVDIVKDLILENQEFLMSFKTTIHSCHSFQVEE